MHTTSQEPATQAQIKLCNDLMDAGAPFTELNWIENNPTKEQCSEFIRSNRVLYNKLKAELGRKRKLDEVASRSTPDEYNVPNM